MKRLLILPTLLVMLLANACRNIRHTTIVNDTDRRYVKLEYAGNIYPTDDATGIKGISPGGYIKYRTNDESLVLNRNADGGMTCQVNGKDEQMPLDSSGKRLLAIAVKAILKHGNYQAQNR